jgi:hypothetical protein
VAAGLARQQRAGGRAAGRCLGRGDEGHAGVFGLQLGLAGGAGVVLAAGHHDVVTLRVGRMARHHDAGVTLLEQQHGRQQQAVQFADAALHQARAETGLAQGTLRLVRPQAVLHRHAGQQRFGRALTPVVARQPADGVRQRVVVQVPARAPGVAAPGGG